MIDEGLLLADGFEDAFLGIGRCFNVTTAVYDYERCITILMERDGMERDEAEEFFEFNVVGAYVGPATPVFLTAMPLEDCRRLYADDEDAA